MNEKEEEGLCVKQLKSMQNKLPDILDYGCLGAFRIQRKINVLMGLRRQEINGLKYSDVDYIIALYQRRVN